ncbi:HlyD family secretion protein [Methylovirgula sp. HY1]|uniref:HlyD family secretion protein n=1 Tax=Methylovirgula sp. HY1 TaxID=2822761 RepID=UPI001C5A949C|nr:efflux RND transporter periplasmic adaptor subunit [Methylovirgula sp. HY1]QXX76443.1 Multidrug resistance protein MdtN [Methylovirgula sp. HY1]
MNEPNGDSSGSGKLGEAESHPTPSTLSNDKPAVPEIAPHSAQLSPDVGNHLPEKVISKASDTSRGGLIVVPLARRRRRWSWVLALVVLGAGAAGGGYYWWNAQQFHLPPGFASGNGRLEADPIDIDTKFAGRVLQVMVDEGDTVVRGQVLARMDTRDLQATRQSYIAQKKQTEHSLDEARALVVQQKTQVLLAQQEIARTQALVGRGFATRELLDQRRQALNGAEAALTAANQRVDQAEHAVSVVAYNIELYNVNIADNTLVAPKYGRIEYRISNVGEVLPAGGKVYTMLDLSYVYMDIYLPTLAAGRAAIGDEARIVLDAFPKIAIPAHITYIATEAQFTPKTVETHYERDRMMFRIRARVDANALKNHEAEVRTGLPGMAYVRLDSKAKWPPQLHNEGMP